MKNDEFGDRMKRLLNNIRNFDDVMNTILNFVVFIIVKASNGIQHIKMATYKLFGIRCYMITDHKFGEKICYKVKDE